MNKRVFRRWANDPAPLQRLLVSRLGLADADAIDLVERGGVYIDGARAGDAQAIVAVGARLTIHVTPRSPAFALAIVYRDADVAIVDKPAGLPSQAERGQHAHSLDAAVTRELGQDARPMHRLDKAVSGLVIVALRASARAALQRAID